MTLTVVYDPDGAATSLDAVRRNDDMTLTEAATSNAESGTVAIDDDDGSIDITGLKRVEVVDDACPVGDQRVWTGYVAPRDYARSKQLGPVGANAREIVISLEELNTILGDHKVQIGKRPAETGGVRLAWLLASGYIDCEDRGKVVYPGVAMDAVDYTGQFGGNVLADIAAVAHYDAFLLLDDEREAIAELFFDDMDRSEAYSSAASITNVDDEVDVAAGVFAAEEPGGEEKLTRTPANVGSGGWGSYAKGNVYRERDATAAAFRARDVDVTTTNAKTLTQARRLVDKWLAQHSAEEDSVRCAVTVGSADTNKIRRGHRVWAKLTFAPGLESGAWCRVLSRTLTLPAGHDLKRRLALELRPQRITSCAGLTDVAEAHGTVTGHVTVENGWARWCSSTIDPGTGPYADRALSDSDFHDMSKANDGDLTTYGWFPGGVMRTCVPGTIVALYVDIELDALYTVCSVTGTRQIGSTYWTSYQPTTVEYWDEDAGVWAIAEGTYSYNSALATPPRWIFTLRTPVDTTKVRLRYAFTLHPVAFCIAFAPTGTRFYDLQVIGVAV